MLKIIGILLVSGAISLHGAHLSVLRRQNAALRAELLELLVRIKNGIENGGLPLTDIYAGFNGKITEKRGFCRILKSGVPDAFARAFEEVRASLPEDCAKLYTALSVTLGKSGFRKAECEALTRAIADITVLEKKYAAQDEAKCVLYRKLGVLCGLLAALILL